MRISRRALLLGAAGAVSGCEGRPSPTQAQEAPAPNPPGTPSAAATPAGALAGATEFGLIGSLPVPRYVASRADADHLANESARHDGSVWSSIYDQVIDDVLLHRAERYDPVLCQMFVQPARGNEAAIFLRQQQQEEQQEGQPQPPAAAWQLVARRSVVSLSNGVSFRLERGMDRGRIVASMVGSIEESVRPLPLRLVGVLQRVWTEMLLRARARTMPEMDLHTSVYHFAHHHLAGTTIVRAKQSLAGRLVQLGERLIDVTTLRKAELDAALADVEARATALLTDLSQLHDLDPRESDWALKRLYGEVELPRPPPRHPQPRQGSGVGKPRPQ